MSSEIDIQQLAVQLKEKRGRRGLREVADEIGGVSASTLSRIEQGKVPDLDTFVRICRWLDIPMDRFIIKDEPSSQKADSSENLNTSSQTLTVHLRADKTLDPKTAKALAHLIQLAYEAIERDEIEGDEE
ncbi:MAG: helix-turn-helix domain-containing protein [Anaerolineae bacterium]|nr:helix-turn-helix domain-containing protein [Anaerolineae bacterium]